LTELFICEPRKVDERQKQKTRGGNSFSLQDSGTTPLTEHWQQERQTEGKKTHNKQKLFGFPLIYKAKKKKNFNLHVHDNQFE